MEVTVTPSQAFNPATMNAGILSQCYGAPAAGSQPGVPFISDWRVQIDRWQSGWRFNPASSVENVVR